MTQGLHMMLADAFQDWFIRFNFREPGSSNIAKGSDYVFYLIFLLSAFFFILLMVLMVYFTFKYRKRPGAVPQRSANHNTILELSWSVIPTILLVWMFFEGFWGFADQLVAPGEASEYVVTARKWSWSLSYPNGATSPISTRSRAIDGGPPVVVNGRKLEAAAETPIFVVPEDKPVRLRMSSIDVIHSFWVPDFRCKFDVFPNRYTSTWFKATKIRGTKTLPATEPDGKVSEWAQWAGTPYEDHWVFCAEYCGASHSDMFAILRVVPYDAFLKIVDDWAKPRGEDWEKGKFYWKAKGCYSCHSIDGSKIVGPTWKNMYGYPVDLTDGRTLTVDADYIRRSIQTPSAEIVRGYPNQMTFQRINPEEERLLIAFMQHISDKGPPPLPKPGDGGATGGMGAAGATGGTAPSEARPEGKQPEAPKK